MWLLNLLLLPLCFNAQQEPLKLMTNYTNLRVFFISLYLSSRQAVFLCNEPFQLKLSLFSYLFDLICRFSSFPYIFLICIFCDMYSDGLCLCSWCYISSQLILSFFDGGLFLIFSCTISELQVSNKSIFLKNLHKKTFFFWGEVWKRVTVPLNKGLFANEYEKSHRRNIDKPTIIFPANFTLSLTKKQPK